MFRTEWSIYTDCAWYSVELEDDTDIDVYIKFKDLEEYDNIKER